MNKLTCRNCIRYHANIFLGKTFSFKLISISIVFALFSFQGTHNVSLSLDLTERFLLPRFVRHFASQNRETLAPASPFAVLRLSKINLMVGLSGLEPPTSRLSGVRSNRLSYKPISWFERWFPTLPVSHIRLPTGPSLFFSEGSSSSNCRPQDWWR